jgi:hypothetical protein
LCGSGASGSRPLGPQAALPVGRRVVGGRKLDTLVAAHTDRGATGTLTYYVSSSLEGKGSMELADKSVHAFVPKILAPPKVGYVNAGLYAVSPVALDNVIGSPDALEHASADLADGGLRW